MKNFDGQHWGGPGGGEGEVLQVRNFSAALSFYRSDNFCRSYITDIEDILSTFRAKEL